MVLAIKLYRILNTKYKQENLNNVSAIMQSK